MDETCGDAEGKAGGGGGIEEEMEVGECSEEEEDEEEDIDLGSSPMTEHSSVMMSMTSPAPTAYEGLASPLRVVSGALTGGKPVVGIKRGPGRPRSRGGGATPVVRPKKIVGPKLKRWKGLLVSGVNGVNNGKQQGEIDDDSTSPIHPSTPGDQVKTPIFVDEPSFDETWPGKVCVLCNLTEHSQLGQGKMCRVECTVEELPKDLPKELLMSPPETPPLDSTSPRQPFQNRRVKGAAKFRNAGGGGQEPVDELSLVGHTDIPEPSSIVDSGYIYVHEWCAMWCTGVTRKGLCSFNNLPAGVMAAVSRRCYHCSRYGAGGPCVIPSCNKHFHTPCAAAASTFQHPKTMTLICSQHIDHIPTKPFLSDVECQTCRSGSNLANLVMCSMCGRHYHGSCIGNSLQPGLRAGWQCAECRICQLCRKSEETNRMLVCDSCDKAYHPYCVRPAMSSVPKVGWKCKRCRLCSDCGARTPGGGLSSRWHSNYTVCDSCYQQRNKGFSCPVCHKAYRAAALREMVRCSQCQRFVHGTCDKEADFVSYQRKKEAHPDYEYICLSCKNCSTISFSKRKDSTDEALLDSSLSVSQESLMVNEDIDLDSEKSDDGPLRINIGLGKGKPFAASKLAKKRLGLGVGPGRPKGSGKMSSLSPSLSQYHKRHRFADFGRKRGAKSKLRGIFGTPGLGLQRPLPDSTAKSEDEPGVENKLVLCSSKDKFVLGQDICVMCGSLGIDQEACLIACAQCGQCYHPYCVTVKVTKVMLQRGWRCLDCTICEGCGRRNDEGRLILCDDCDISYHIYCMDPPLGSVPTGGWKCRWCAHCTTCGASTPGVNSTWQSNFSQCGACASLTACPACQESYSDGDLIIKCVHCDRWLHCYCDNISNEQEAEACCAQSYTCILCRPGNVALVLPATPARVPSPDYTPDGKSSNDYYVDGICLSECGLQHIKHLSLENNNQPVRRKRPGFKRPQDNDMLALDVNDPDNDNPNAIYKDGMIWGSKDNGPVSSPPEGFSLYTMESGVVILKRKKQRNLQKLGIGGFSASKMRSSRFKDDEEGSTHPFAEDKPRRKPRINKKRSKLAETYPSYLQEAFFGRELLDTTKETTQELDSSSEESDDGKSNKVSHDKTIMLSQEEDVSDSEGLKDILHLSDNLLPNDLVNTIMNDRDGMKAETLIGGSSSQDTQNQKDELSEILGPHFSLESMVRETGLPNMDSKDVEEIFKGVLTDESQESQSSGAFPPRGQTPGTPHPQMSPQQSLPSGMLSRTNSVTPSVHTNLSSPIGFPSASPYNSEYSNSPQFSPEGSPWGGDDNTNSAKTSLKMEADEPLGQMATMAPVLYANIHHSDWKKEFPNWSDRFKQILKKWRTLPAEKKAPFVQQAKENRSIRIKKTQQEQDKTQVSKTTREAEQERQWKHIQAMRQQQLHTQARNQVTRVHRQISGDGTIVQYPSETQNTQPHLTQQLQVSTPQEPINNIALASPRGPQQFTSPTGIKNPRALTSPAPLFPRMVGIRPPSQFATPRQEEMNRQLRDLLQRQQIKQETTDGQNQVATAQIRQPMAQVRQAIPQQAIHNVDARVRLLLQQQRGVFPGTQVRTRLDQFNLVQRQQFPQNTVAPIVRPPHQIITERVQQQQVEQRLQGARDGEEIPDSVTAEIEKLEQEGGAIGEADAVSAIFGDLGDDDDELLAEMGADFNILEYADPELDSISGGEKTNILDDLEAEVVKKKNSPAIRNNEVKDSQQEEKVKAQPITQQQPQRPTGAPTQTQSPIVHIPQQVVTSIPGQTIQQVKTVNKTFSTQFATPPAPLPRMQLMTGAQSPRPQIQSPIGGTQGQNFIPIPAPPPYPGPPPPYPGQLQSNEQPLLLEDLLEEEKREQEQQSVTPGPSSGASLMSDADFEMLRADVLGTNSQVSSPPHTVPSVQILNIPIQPAPPAPPDSIVTEQDKQIQMQYEQWLQSNNAALTHQLKYYESEVQKLRKKSLNSKQRQLRKNGNELTQKDALELQRVTVEQTGLQKHLEAARKQSRTHSMIIQEYQNKQDQKNGVVSNLVGSAPHSVGSASPQSPSGMMSPGVQSALPSPQTAASPLHHSPRIGTPLSQSGEDKNDSGLASPRSVALAPTPPSPHQFQIRHQGMVPRFSRSPEGTLRPRIVSLQHQGGTVTSYASPRAFATSPQQVMSPNMPQQQTIRIQSIQGLTPQQQQLLMQKQQLQQQKQQLLQQQIQQQQIQQQQLQQQQLQQQQMQQQQIQQQQIQHQQIQQHDLQEVGLVRQLDGSIQRQVLLRQGIIQDDQNNQLILQRQQLVQQNRQLIIGQGKVGQFRQIVQQNQNFQQNPQMQNQNNMNQTYVSGSSMPPSPIINQAPSPISTSMNNVQYNPSSSPMHPQSPMISQYHTSSSPMPHQSPRVQNYQTASSPMTPQSPMVYSGLQTPTSPMPQFNQPNSPMPPVSPRVQQYNQGPPSSPMSSQNSMMQPQFVPRPNSPMVPMGSPMPIRRPSSTGGSVGNSPAAERPQSVENPRTPQEQEGNGAGGGGNPYNPHNPIPLPPELGRIRYVKLGLRGGSPMWSDKAVPRKPLHKGKVGHSLAGTSGNTDEKSKMNKVPSLVCVDYNDFDEESRTPPMTPPTKPASIKKSETGTVKTRQSEDTDSEATVYEDIVLVESCKETNLEVEELQSALEDNVMSTVVSMPMSLDPSHLMNASDILDDCLVSSSDLVVLEDVDNGNSDILILDGDINDTLKVDEDIMEFEEEPSPPGRKRMTGKVLPNQPIQKEVPKSETPKSPTNETEANETDEKDEKKSENKTETSEATVPNVVVSRNSVAFTPVSMQKSIPTCSERKLSIQQAAVATLVQGAVNAAAKFAAETQKNSTEVTTTQLTPNATAPPQFSRPTPSVRPTSTGYLNQALFGTKPEDAKTDPKNEIKAEPKIQNENGSNLRNLEKTKLVDLLNKNDSLEKDKVWGIKQNVIKKAENEEDKKTEQKLNDKVQEKPVKVEEKNDKTKIIQNSEMNSHKSENIVLPSVSSSILEAQLTTSMLRTENPSPQYFYAIVNHNVPKEIKKESINDDLRVEGLAAHLQRTIKNEEFKNEMKVSESEMHKNSRMQPNLKPGGVYVPAKMVGPGQYKFVHTTQASIESANDLANKEINHYINKMRDANAALQKSEQNKLEKDKLTNDILQQRIVSSSEISQLLEKETHHVSFSGAKPQQKEEPRKFVSLSNMLLSKKEEEKRMPLPRTSDDSQNVLLKQLLQNTACATTTSSPQTAPSLPIVPSLEDQLARPVPPTPTSLLPPVLNEPPKPVIKEMIPTSRPLVQTPTPMEVQRSVPSCLDELLSPPHQPPTPTIIKREPISFSQPSPIMTPTMEIKKENLPLTLPVAVEVKKEVMSSDEMLSPGFRMEPEHPGESALQDIKKMKRRQYQQKRRQSLGKEAVGGTPKKRPRKSSKVEEDYDSYIDSVMHQLRQTPAMTICEPNLTYNFTGSPVYGSGDLSKVNSCTRLGELRGTYGQAYLPSENDHYNTLPFGDLPPCAPTTPSTQRGFYNEEFAPLKLHSTKDEFDDRKYDFNRDRDNETPDTIISSSSPECVMPEFPNSFPGLQFVDSDGEEDKFKLSRFSPDIPIISPLIVKPKPIRFYRDMDKENEGPQSKKHCENVTVTLTLNSQAADDVLSVLRNLANVLRIPVPVNYSVTERSTLPNHKLGLYKIKGKDGKDNGHIDIQSILNGSAKFCRHCDVVIVNNVMRKKASEMPLVARQGEEDLYFCSTNCYMQLALAHPPPVHNEKASSVVEHHSDITSKKSRFENSICDSFKLDIKKEKITNDVSSFARSGKRDVRTFDKSLVPVVKKSPSRYRVWTTNNVPQPATKLKKPSDKEMADILFKYGITVMPTKVIEDSRVCLFCHQTGDGVSDGPARLLNYDVNKWVHLNCALWSDEVYETVNGGLVNVETALQSGLNAVCAYCNATGATLKCYKMRCTIVYHLPCAVKDQCVFYKNKTLYCNSHAQKTDKENELTTLSVMRRVYINRDENRQVASVMHHSEQNNLLRVGSLIFLSVGQLLPHQLPFFHTSNYIYPIGYKILRMYWSMRNVNKRSKYLCSIHEVDGRPEFKVIVQEKGEVDLEIKDSTPKGVWQKILEPIVQLRKNDNLVGLFSTFVTGEDLFGLTEPAIVKVLESLPGVEALTDYKFKYGRNPLLELPLAINPTGCARSEGKPRGPGCSRKAHTQRTCSVSLRPSFAPSTPQSGEPSCPYSKQFVHSKSSQYKKMKQEWRNNVFLARSKIQGLGLYAARDLERHTMVIEYIGEIIRTELAETREKQYEAKNRGIYMFRLDEERVVDATLCGGLARYINHSCSPNCVAETVEVDRDLRIIIFTKRRINRGEELAYDYKFDIEDDQHKIPCMCGAHNCRKWMN